MLYSRYNLVALFHENISSKFSSLSTLQYIICTVPLPVLQIYFSLYLHLSLSLSLAPYLALSISHPLSRYLFLIKYIFLLNSPRYIKCLKVKKMFPNYPFKVFHQIFYLSISKFSFYGSIYFSYFSFLFSKTSLVLQQLVIFP